MKEEFDFSLVPHLYPMCLNRECKQAETCLRQLLEQSIPANIQQWVIISPKLLVTLKGDCPFYRPRTKIRFAKGFVKILEDMPHKQMLKVIPRLTAFFGRRTYYRVRKGERLLSPDEQQQFYEILKKCGVTTSYEFDAYIESYNW